MSESETNTATDQNPLHVVDSKKHVWLDGLNGVRYDVYAIPWIMKNDFKEAHTEVNPFTQKVKFDAKGYVRDMVKACVKIGDRAFTDADFPNLDGKSGDLVEIAINQLNNLTLEDIRNLMKAPSQTISSTQ